MIDVSALVQVLIASLLGGVGLVALFALGLVAMSAYLGHPGETAEGGAVSAGRKPVGLLIAVTCIAVVVTGVGYGLYLLLSK